MKTIQTKSSEILLVDVPKDAYDFKLRPYILSYKIDVPGCIGKKIYSYIDCEKGQIVGKVSEFEDLTLRETDNF
jgi:hypothetical protein